MSLNSPGVSGVKLTATMSALMSEWLGGYFDGGTHQIGLLASGVQFPKCAIEFGQGEVVQPMETPEQGSEIRLTMLPRGKVYDEDAVGKLVTQEMTLNFWVRAKQQGKGQSKLLAQTIGDLLVAVLEQPDARLPLAEKGITHLTPRSPVEIANMDWAERMVGCGAEVRYYVAYQAGS